MRAKDLSIFEELAHRYAQDQTPPDPTQQDPQQGGQQNPPQGNEQDPEQDNVEINPDQLQKGQAVYDVSGKEFTVLDDSENGLKTIMPSEQQGQQTPSGIKQLAPEELSSSYTIQPTARKVMAEEDGPYVLNWGDFRDLLGDMQSAVNKEDMHKLLEHAQDLIELIMMNISMPSDTDIGKAFPKEEAVSVHPAFVGDPKKPTNESRQRDTGKYTYDKQQRLCTCGHPLGAHSAEHSSDSWPCFANDLGGHSTYGVEIPPCDCEFFTPTKPVSYISDEEYGKMYGDGPLAHLWKEEEQRLKEQSEQSEAPVSIHPAFRKAQFSDIPVMNKGKENESGLTLGEAGFTKCMNRLKELVKGKYAVIDILLTLGEEFDRPLVNKVLDEARGNGIL